MDNTPRTDADYMELALSLAEKGRGKVSPNPMVGALVVHDGLIVGSGYHKKAGEDHAEVIALKDAGKAADGATLYVTLEPCCHYGKTPPCTDFLMHSGLKRVVAAMADPNPKVSGKGISLLSQAGIETSVGLLGDKAAKLNEAFIKHIKTGLPFLTLKLACTLDGRIADAWGKSKWITGEETRKRVHLWRSWSDAVMVGIRTVLADDPYLTVRAVEGKNPLKVIVDSTLKTPIDANALAGCAETYIAVIPTADKKRKGLFREKGVTIIDVEERDGRVYLPALAEKLGEKGITSILCEGGGFLAAALLREKLADKVIFTYGPMIMGCGIHAVEDICVSDIENALRLSDMEYERIGDDLIVTGYPVYKE